jgi:predicted acyltransferase
MDKSLKTRTSKRLISLDVLRGFDMIWIMGGYQFFGSLSKVVDWEWVHIMSFQLSHSSWNGFRFFDLIFPLFMFISGVAIPFAITSKLEKGVPKSKLIPKIFRRMLLLIFLGLVQNNILRNGISDLRAAHVLAQIGIAYFFAALIVINTSAIKTRILWIIGIMVTVATLQLFVPVPGFGAGVITPEGSINAWIDQNFLPGVLAYGTYDPEGVLCVFSAISVTLIGTLAGNILRNKNILSDKKAIILSISGVVLIIIALALSPWYPIIKKIWTVPFDLLTAGISMVLLSLFYFIIDVKGWKKGTLFFKVFGLNSITIYIGTRVFDFYHTSGFLFGWLSNLTGEFAPTVIIAGVIFLEWLFLYFLYRKKIFLRV